MKKLLVLICFLPQFSCVTTTRIAEYKINPIDNSTALSSIAISPNTGREDCFCFSLKNNRNEPILIDWDNSYLLIDDETYRCIHNGIRFMEKAASQAKTPVAPGSEISECLTPEKNIEISDVYKGWIISPLSNTYGEYSIAIIHCEKQENIRGSFSMDVKDKTTPMHNMSSTNAAMSTLYVLSTILLISSILVLL